MNHSPACAWVWQAHMNLLVLVIFQQYRRANDNEANKSALMEL